MIIGSRTASTRGLNLAKAPRAVRLVAFRSGVSIGSQFDQRNIAAAISACAASAISGRFHGRAVRTALLRAQTPSGALGVGVGSTMSGNAASKSCE